MTYSDQLVEMVKHFEGCKLTAYKDSADVLTIGYGETEGVTSGLTITQEQADFLLHDALEHVSADVSALIRVPLNQNQFDALVDFAYNLGVEALKHSTLLKQVNSKSFPAAADEFVKWDHVRGRELVGLKKRRLAERALFITPVLNRLTNYNANQN